MHIGENLQARFLNRMAPNFEYFSCVYFLHFLKFASYGVVVLTVMYFLNDFFGSRNPLL
jgi:hypothetical protein